MRSRHLNGLKDKRLIGRANRILDNLFERGSHSIRQFCSSDADAKGCYRFLSNKRVSEADLCAGLSANCSAAAAGKFVVCIQDTTRINLSTHTGRIQSADKLLGATNNKDSNDLGFFLHPGLVLDAANATPYGYAGVRIWNRDCEGKGKDKGIRKARMATIEIRYLPVALARPPKAPRSHPATVPVYLIEARETGYEGKDAICWRLLTTLEVPDTEMARTCIEWYSWRWTIEEVFRILKKEGFDVEASELERGGSVRKLSLLMLEVIIKLFLMRLAYSEPELSMEAACCFGDEEQKFMEQQIPMLEGKTQKQKNPYPAKELKRYAWVIARLGGWMGYESKRRPGITTLWTGLRYFYAAFQGWHIHRNVSTR